MSGTPMRVVPARREHLAGIVAIYARAAESSPATFDLVGHPFAWWEEVLAATDEREGRLLLAAVADDGAVAGYARSGQHREKPAYRTTVETSIYVGADHRGAGVGARLYASLLERLDSSGLRLAVGGVTEPNAASTRLHLAAGFSAVGRFREVGFKFDSYWDVTWYQRRLGTRTAPDQVSRA